MVLKGVFCSGREMGVMNEWDAGVMRRAQLDELAQGVEGVRMMKVLRIRHGRNKDIWSPEDTWSQVMLVCSVSETPCSHRKAREAQIHNSHFLEGQQERSPALDIASQPTLEVQLQQEYSSLTMRFIQPATMS
jgi:hypothetical protein